LTDEYIENEFGKYGKIKKCVVVRSAVVSCRGRESAENIVKELHERETFNGVKLVVVQTKGIVEPFKSFPTPILNRVATAAPTISAVDSIGSSLQKREFESCS